MCIFTAHVEVGDTRIFARDSARPGGRHQYLVYQMVAQSQDPVAMVLPLPVPPGTPEEHVHFFSLADWPYCFQALAELFPYPWRRHPIQSLLAPFMKGGPRLMVVEVGSYEASFVPTLQDFSRLDERFRLPTEVWDQLPDYQDYGFAVFQLQAGETRIHPMAFEFPRRDPRVLFFPTVHVHDGQAHSAAHFDHALYCQTARRPRGWQKSKHKPKDHRYIWNRSEEVREFLDMHSPVYRLRMEGVLANRDVMLLS